MILMINRSQIFKVKTKAKNHDCESELLPTEQHNKTKKNAHIIEMPFKTRLRIYTWHTKNFDETIPE